jgi:hypothetical protein
MLDCSHFYIHLRYFQTSSQCFYSMLAVFNTKDAKLTI